MTSISILYIMKTSNQFNSFAISHPSSLSRRRWIGSGLATCGYLAAGGFVLAQTDDTPMPQGTPCLVGHGSGSRSRIAVPRDR